MCYVCVLRYGAVSAAAPVAVPAAAEPIVARDVSAIVLYLLLFLVAWTSRFRLPETALNALLPVLGLVLRWLTHSPSEKALLQHWPTRFEHIMEPSHATNIAADDFCMYAMCPNRDCGKIFPLAPLLDKIKHSNGQFKPRCDQRRDQMHGVEREADEPPDIDAQALGAQEHIDDDDEAATVEEEKKEDQEEQEQKMERPPKRPRLRQAPVRYTPGDAGGAAAAASAVSGSAGAAAAAAASAPLGDLCNSPLMLPPKRTKGGGAAAAARSTDVGTQPILAYPYHGLLSPLQKLLSHPGVEHKCEMWRQRYNVDKEEQRECERSEAHDRDSQAAFLMSDVFDGEQWERYLYVSKTTQRPWPEVMEQRSAQAKETSAHALRCILALGPAEAAVADATDALNEARDNGPAPAPAAAAAAAAAAVRSAALKRRGHDTKIASLTATLDACTAELAHVRATQVAASAASAAAAALASQELGDPDREALLAAPGTLGLAMNVDWWQPNQNNGYSMGAVYLTVLNLPREERYRPENTIHVGVLPGPRQTSTPALQHALQPLIDELQLLFGGHNHRGVWMNTADAPHGRFVRAFLLCAICDLPAAREVGGFASFNATCGCAFCDMALRPRGPGAGSYRDYALSATGPPDTWPLRTDASHRAHATEWSQQRTQAGRAAHMKQHGSRMCALMQLKYFDMIRGIPVDVMHNVFLGSCKRLVKLCTQSSSNTEALLSPADLMHLQRFMDALACPPDVGRIPIRLAQGFSSFKAAEWNNWICMFAVPSLRDLLRCCPNTRFQVQHLHLFIQMREIALIMRSYTIDYATITRVDGLLHAMLRDVETLFGANAITPNLHLGCHLASMLRDYGPPAGWWCNSYERMNGLLTNLPHNRKDIPLCTMRRTLLLVGTGHAVRQRVDAPQRRVLGTGPTRDDFRSILAMMFGEQDDAAELEGQPVAEGELEAAGDGESVLLHSAVPGSLMGTFLPADGSAFAKRVSRTTASGRKRVDYTWGGPGRSRFFRGAVHALHSDPASIDLVRGSETLLGELQHRGRGRDRLGVVLGNLQPEHVDYYNAYHPAPPKRDSNKARKPKHFEPEHLQNCLEAHYIEAYDQRFMRHARADPTRAQEYQGMREAEAAYRGAPLDARLKTKKHSAFISALHPLFSPRLELFDTLELCGEVYGSMAGTNHRSSFVTVRFREKLGAHWTTNVFFGQVRCFLRHAIDLAPLQPMGRPHDDDRQAHSQHAFALMYWYKEANLDEHFRFQADARPVGDDQHELVQAAKQSAQASLFNGQFPFLECKPSDPDLRDIVPVHRICGRWIPATRNADAQGKGRSLWQACPIPSKVHA